MSTCTIHLKNNVRVISKNNTANLILSYGSECWAVTNKEKSRIKAVEMAIFLIKREKIWQYGIINSIVKIHAENYVFKTKFLATKRNKMVERIFEEAMILKIQGIMDKLLGDQGRNRKSLEL